MCSARISAPQARSAAPTLLPFNSLRRTSGGLLLFCSVPDMRSAPVVCEGWEHNTPSESAVQYAGIPLRSFSFPSRYSKIKTTNLILKIIFQTIQLNSLAALNHTWENIQVFCNSSSSDSKDPRSFPGLSWRICVHHKFHLRLKEWFLTLHNIYLLPNF